MTASALHILQEAFPILGRKLDDLDCHPIDLTEKHLQILGIESGDMEALSTYVFLHPYRIGGYLEQRSLYKRSTHFGTGTFERNIHLGVDLWAKEGTVLYCPLDGIIHSVNDNKGLANYGPTVILEHESDEQSFYSLYGHLSRSSLLSLSVGHKLVAGEVLGSIGSMEENGNWPPHVHIQLIRDLEWNLHDYPGVCARKDLKWYRLNCPDAMAIIR